MEASWAPAATNRLLFAAILPWLGSLSPFTIDARTQNQQTQYELRKQVVRLRKWGFSNKQTAEIVGLSTAHASTIWQKYLQGGIEAIKPGKRGRRHGAQRVLDVEQETSVRDMLVDKAPDQLKLPFALWTRDAVRLAIKKKYGVELPLRTITDYLKLPPKSQRSGPMSKTRQS